MARSGDTEIDFNQGFFDTVLRSAPIDNLARAAAESAAAQARATAPVDSGDYRRGIRVEPRESRYRRVWMVVGNDPKTLLIESRAGTLARALKATRA